MRQRAIIVLEVIEGESDFPINTLARATADDIADHFGDINVICVGELKKEIT